MSSPCRKRLRKVQIAAWLLGAVLTHRAGASANLTVCIDQANPTMAMDARVVRALANTQGYAVTLVRFEGYGKGGEGFPLSRFAKMAASECQLIMGFPLDVSDPNLPPHVEATAAYASTGFVLVRRRSARSVSLSELPRGSEVGIAQLDTYVGLLFSRYPNIVMHVYAEDADMLADLEAQRIVAGLAWQPSIAHYQRMHPKRGALSARILPGEHMVWNLVALYAPESQSAADSFNRGLQLLQSNGQLASLIKPFQRAAAADPAQRSSRATAPSVQPAVYLQTAVPDTDNAVRLIEVADVNTEAVKKPRRSPPALYTKEQAEKGAIAYYQNCAMCHGPLLDGQAGGFSGPALKGPDFADPSYDFHVNEIFNFVAKLMPSATPGSLSPEQDVEIMAFILRENGYPAGTKELTYDAAAKSRAPMRYYGK